MPYRDGSHLREILEHLPDARDELEVASRVARAQVERWGWSDIAAAHLAVYRGEDHPKFVY